MKVGDTVEINGNQLTITAVEYNEGIANAGHPVTVTELFKAVESDEIKSAQKVSALVKKLVDAGRIRREEDKKRAYFTIAE